MFDTLKFCPIGPIDLRCMVNTPRVPQTRVGLGGKGMFAVVTRSLSGRGGCIGSIRLGKERVESCGVSCSSVVRNKALRFLVAGRH